MKATNTDRALSSLLAIERLAGKVFIAGEWRSARSGSVLDVVNPSTGESVSSLADGGAEDIDDAVLAAKQAGASAPWRKMRPDARERLLVKLAELVEENVNTIAEIEAIDVGMPIGLARLTVLSAIATLRYMAGFPSRIEGRTIPISLSIPDTEFFAYTLKEPVGVIGAIIPWNAPFMLALWKMAPALASGCTIVLKPSEEACLSILMLAQLAVKAGVPPGVINVVTGKGPAAGMALARHADVSRITFTGSTATGQLVARAAADTLKKVSLELGGKSPQLLFSDADVDAAIPDIANAVFLHSGQICVAGTRLYVHRKIRDQVVEKMAAYAGKLTIGPALDKSTQMGPVASRRHLGKIHSYLEGAAKEGAPLVTGRTEDLPRAGFYVAPTVIAARQDMTIAREEVFGPVLSVIPFEDMDEAVTLANDSTYGLTAYIWTRDLSTALTVAPRLKVGKVAINTAAHPYPSIPEGGCKASGYGRDLGPESVEACLDTKVVMIRAR